MTGLKTMMSSDATDGGTFFPTSSGAATDFNELGKFYPLYNVTNVVNNVNMIVVEDHLEGSREAPGDGVILNREDGRSVRRSAVIIVPAAIAVRDQQTINNPDVFTDAAGTIWVVKRILKEDDYVQHVLCIHRQDSELRREHRAG